MYFQAALKGNGLDFYMIPVGADQQPDYNNASQYSFQKRAGLKVPLQPPSASLPGQSGQSSQLQLTFSRGSGPVSSPSSNMGQSQPSYSNVQRDQRLIGGWRYTQSYTSGDFSAVSEWYMQLNADGTYRYGDGQVMGGGAGSSFDSGQGGVETGQWKTENKVIYFNEGYGWQPYATYIVDSNSMLFKFDSGSKELWDRYR